MLKQRLALTDRAGAGSKAASSIWSLAADGLTCLETGTGGVPIVLVPSERVTVVTVDLPLPSRAKRLAALPFAVEDMLAEPIEAVHLALGAEVAPRRHVAGAVRHEVMRGWVERIEAEGLARAAVMPDALVLPQPGEGGWSVAVDGERTRVRTGDGAGFALPTTLLAAAWRAAGQPDCASYGEPLPEEMAVIGSVPLAAPPAAAVALDLRQGAYGLRRGPLPAVGRRLLAVAAIGLVAQAAVAGADVLVLRHQANVRAEAVRTLVAKLDPTAVIGDDVAADAAALLPDATVRPTSGFLPLLSRTAAALQPLGSAVTWRGVAYAASDDALTVQVSTTDMGQLQRVQQALAGAGLSPTSGAASTDNGRSDGEFVVHAGAAP